jgi:hypothetical protein
MLKVHQIRKGWLSSFRTFQNRRYSVPRLQYHLVRHFLYGGSPSEQKGANLTIVFANQLVIVLLFGILDLEEIVDGERKEHIVLVL